MTSSFSRPFRRPLLALLAASALLAGSCAAPRAIVTTGKVTPQGEFRVGYNQGLNIATAPLDKGSAAEKAAASQAAPG